jgi:hypothetical protein
LRRADERIALLPELPQHGALKPRGSTMVRASPLHRNYAKNGTRAA